MAREWSSYLFNAALVLLVATFVARIVAFSQSNRSLFGFLKADHTADGPSAADFDAPWAYRLYWTSTIGGIAAALLIAAGLLLKLF